jgi:hypothetical protein
MSVVECHRFVVVHAAMQCTCPATHSTTQIFSVCRLRTSPPRHCAWLGPAADGRARSTCSATAVNMPTAATIALQAGHASWPRRPILFFVLICICATRAHQHPPTHTHTLAPKRKSGEKTYMSLLHTGGENKCLFASRHSSTLCTASISLACALVFGNQCNAKDPARSGLEL